MFLLKSVLIQSCELYDPTADQWTVIIDQCLPFFTSCAPSFVLESEGDAHHVALLGGHSFANDSDHSLLQVVHFGGADKSLDSLPRVDSVATCTFNSHGVQYCTLNVMKLPAQYVGRFH